ncbi:DUF302 domain-containing protein [Vulgatibacter sp.]|uniref:DUF302 domain-containing protein n=1 Tax=Vulgatibacter sp. TaxID=1971226 RepID=UPI00356AA643
METSTESTRGVGPSYGYTLRFPGEPFAKLRERTIEALKREGFGVLTEIDVQETLQKKLGENFRNYVILGACNPQLAHRGLQAELGLGLLLPCNVVVWEEDDGAVVSMLRPDLMFQAARAPALEPIAKEADERIRRAMEHLRSGAPQG